VRLSYYEPKFPYPQGASAGPYPKFLNFYEPQFPYPQGASAGPYPRLLTSPGMNGMGNYRPNQGFYRGNTPGVSQTLGFDLSSIDPSDPMTWILGLGAAYVVYALVTGVKSHKGALSRLRARRSRG
jgi:hypothetical protein